MAERSAALTRAVRWLKRGLRASRRRSTGADAVALARAAALAARRDPQSAGPLGEAVSAVPPGDRRSRGGRRAARAGARLLRARLGAGRVGSPGGGDPLVAGAGDLRAARRPRARASASSTTSACSPTSTVAGTTRSTLYRRRGRAASAPGTPADVAFTDCNIGEILSDQGRLDEAEDHLQRARRVWSATRRAPVGGVRRRAAGAARARRGDRPAGGADARGGDGRASRVQHGCVRRLRAGADRRGRGAWRRLRSERSRSPRAARGGGPQRPAAASGWRGSRWRGSGYTDGGPRRADRGAGHRRASVARSTTSRPRSTRCDALGAADARPARASGTRS